MKILLTGATGFIGRHLLRYLSREHEVITLVRDSRDKVYSEDKLAGIVTGDLRDKRFYKKIPSGIDLVCHAAGILGRWGVDPKVYYDVNVQGTENLLNICLNKEISRIIYISSAGILGCSDSGLLNERSLYNPFSVYEISKAEAEKRVIKFSKDNDIRFTIIRPEFVYGEGNLHILGLFKAIKARRFFLVNKGDSLVHPTYIGDLIQALGLIINSEKYSNIYIIAGERYLTVNEFAGVISKAIGVAPPWLTVPYPIAKAMALLSEFAASIFDFEPVFTQSRLDFFSRNRACSIELAVSELGYKPIKLEQGILNTISWYKDNGYL